MSNDKFALRLESMGVKAPTKVSAKTGKVAWAFAKTDEAFTDLLEHDDSDVQALVAARLGVKTTIAETRALMMLETARRGPLPVYLNYWGAKTTGRYSGGNKINWQNLPARGPSAGMRQAICAPAGHVVVVGDSSNIELRVAMCAAQQTDVVMKILAGEDLYCDFASKMFGRTITKADKKERLLGKIAMLSLQYGAGWRKFKEMVRQQSGEVLTDEAAEAIVQLYRRTHHKIVDMWTRFEEVLLPEIANGNPNLVAVEGNGWCLCTGEGFGVGGGAGVAYHQLKKVASTDKRGNPSMEWQYTMGGKPVKLYGGKAFENYCQHVARQIVMWQTARIDAKYPVALSVHDEAVCVVRDDQLDDCVKYMNECLSMTPPWCRGQIPLACEVGSGVNYGDAK
jgi:DNA polymerase